MLRTDQVAIDGPAGTGKSTVAKRLAALLDLPLLNTGQLYRTVAFIVVNCYRHTPHDVEFVEKVAFDCSFHVEDGEVVWAEDVNDRYNVRGMLGTPEISELASLVSSYKGVREALLDFQQLFAEQYGAVMEGRDIGTVIMPNAAHKFFLTCDPEERVRRRKAQGIEETVAGIAKRDNRDSGRETAPLMAAPGAIEIDTTSLSIDEVLDLIMHQIRLSSRPVP